MLKQLTTFGAIAAAATVATIPAAPAEAQGYYGRDAYYGDRYDRGDRRVERRYDRRAERRYDRRDDRRAVNYNYGYQCRRSDGTTGTIIGAIAGGLLGREVVGRYGDRTAGAIVGAGAGALAGRAIDRSGSNNRC